MYALGIVVFVMLCLFFIHRSKPAEHLISEEAYGLLSSGMNLPATGGDYSGGMHILNAAENANTVSDIIPRF